MPMDLNKHKEAFIIEANNLIKVMNHSLIELEKKPSDEKQFYSLFRSVHTLKSLSATMGYNQLMSLCHEMEDLLDEVRHHKIHIKHCVDLLFKSFDFLSMNIKKISEDQGEINANAYIEQIKKIILDGSSVNTILPETEDEIENETIEKIKSIEVKVERLDVLLNLAEELLVSKMKLDTIEQPIDYSELIPSIESLGRLISDLQYHVMQVRLVPIDFIFNRFYRLVRDLAKKQDKEINLEVSGGEIELDRSLIDEIGESISHLIRNAIDHGLETTEERLKKNKPAQGTIQLRATRSKDTAVIEVSDDGAGLDMPAIKKAAQNNKNFESLKNDQDLIFSGISTTKQVTTLSGRGLGLSIVKQKISSIGGNIRVESIPNTGTSFFLEIPLTLAIIRTLFVDVSGETYAIPIEDVERLTVVTREDFKGLLDQQAIIFENENIPIIHLAKLFDRPINTNLIKQPIVIVSKGAERIGLAVDNLETTQEIIIKPLSGSLRDNKFFSGAAMIGAGRMVLILDLGFLLKSRGSICTPMIC